MTPHPTVSRSHSLAWPTLSETSHPKGLRLVNYKAPRTYPRRLPYIFGGGPNTLEPAVLGRFTPRVGLDAPRLLPQVPRGLGPSSRPGMQP